MGKPERYSIYDLIGKQVSFVGRGNESIRGFCDDVIRKTLDNHIVITVDGRKHILEEPKKILVKNNRIVFCYGHDKNEDDVEFCGERFDVKWGEDIRQSIGRARGYREFVLTIEEKKREEV